MSSSNSPLSSSSPPSSLVQYDLDSDEDDEHEGGEGEEMNDHDNSNAITNDQDLHIDMDLHTNEQAQLSSILSLEKEEEKKLNENQNETEVRKGGGVKNHNNNSGHSLPIRRPDTNVSSSSSSPSASPVPSPSPLSSLFPSSSIYFKYTATPPPSSSTHIAAHSSSTSLIHPSPSSVPSPSSSTSLSLFRPSPPPSVSVVSISPMDFDRNFHSFNSSRPLNKKTKTPRDESANETNEDKNKENGNDDPQSTLPNKKRPMHSASTAPSLSKTFIESTTLHAKSTKDKFGLSYLSPPFGFRPLQFSPSVRCVPPRSPTSTPLSTIKSHSSSIHSMKFLPSTGHLLFSSSFDKSVKIWNIDNVSSPTLLRTLLCHEEAIREIQLSNDGRKLITASFDGYVKCFDSETGKCLTRIHVGNIQNNKGGEDVMVNGNQSNTVDTSSSSSSSFSLPPLPSLSSSSSSISSRVRPLCCHLHPSPSKNSSDLLIGTSNHKILQIDLRLSPLDSSSTYSPPSLVQSYSDHMGSINSLTFIRQDDFFVSTADDKRVFVWEYGIPVVVQYVSDNDLHSISTMSSHPQGKFLVGQSQNNSIVTFSVEGEKIKLNRKKRFHGHRNAGYSCGLTFSPDGEFLLSGDGMGRVFCWEWKSGKFVNKFSAHSKLTVAVEWKPNSNNVFATGSWDSEIKFWG